MSEPLWTQLVAEAAEVDDQTLVAKLIRDADVGAWESAVNLAEQSLQLVLGNERDGLGCGIVI